MLSHGDSCLSILLDRLMFNKLCMDASMCMLMNVAKKYAGLLNGEQTNVTSADNLVCYHSTLKKSEWEVNLLNVDAGGR